MNTATTVLKRLGDPENRKVALLMLAGVALRLWYMYDFSGAPNFAMPVGADVEEYCARARELLTGRFFPAAPDIHAPVYSWFMAAFFRICGFAVPALRSFQLALNFGAWFALYLLLRRSGTPIAVRVVFFAMGMLLPVPVFYQAELVSETLLLPEAAAVFWLLRASECARSGPRRSGAAFAAGILLGVMNLTHPLTLFFSAAEVLYSVRRGARRHAALMALGVLLAVGGFCTAASCRYGEVRGIQANSAFNLFLGNNPAAGGGCYLRPGMRWRNAHREAAREAARRGVSVDAVWLGRVADFWVKHPFRGMLLWLKKACMVFSPSERASGSDIPPLLCFTRSVFFGRLLTPAVFLLAGFGLWTLWRRRCRDFDHWLLLFFALYVSQIVTVTSGRYRLLMLTSVFLFSAVGACAFDWRRFWYLPLLAVLGCGMLTVTDYGGMRDEAASLYAEVALRRGAYRWADELAAYAEHAPVHLDPARLANLRGAAAERLGDLKAAEAHYRRAAELEPEMPQAWMNLANLAAGDPRRAEALYRRALECEPGSALVRYNYAFFLAHSGRWKEAAPLLAASLAADPANHAGWNLSGYIAFQMRDYSRAAECYARAAEALRTLAGDSSELRRLYLNNRRIALEHQR